MASGAGGSCHEGCNDAENCREVLARSVTGWISARQFDMPGLSAMCGEPSTAACRAQPLPGTVLRHSFLRLSKRVAHRAFDERPVSRPGCCTGHRKVDVMFFCHVVPGDAANRPPQNPYWRSVGVPIARRKPRRGK